MTHRPNILFLMNDEHRADVTGYEGNEIIRTPVLDELARTPEELEQFFCGNAAKIIEIPNLDRESTTLG